jgi:parvulin-like peptidyl-prolyl isomerase
MAKKKDTPEKLNKVVARVNGNPIYDDDLTPYVSREVRKFKKFSPKRDTSALEKRLKQKALDKVISQEVLNQESRRLEIKDIEKQVQEKIDDLRKKYKDEEHFNKMLKRKKSTQKDLRKRIRDNIYLTEYLKKQGIVDPEIPEEEIKKYYEVNKRSFKRKESVEVSHILIKVDQSATPEQKEEAREKAEKIRKEVRDGKDFAEMAREHSNDGAAPGGGNLGYIHKRYMPPEFDKAAFSLDTGEISDVIQTKHGHHIIKVTGKKPAGITPYPEVKDFIRKYLQEGKYKEKLAAHMKELREKAKIEILLDKS